MNIERKDDEPNMTEDFTPKHHLSTQKEIDEVANDIINIKKNKQWKNEGALKLETYKDFIPYFTKEEIEILQDLCKNVVKRDLENFKKELDKRKVRLYNDAEIDVLIYDTIVLLNEKGYLTKGCCEGHEYNNVGNYISFSKQGKIPSIEGLSDFAYDKPSRNFPNTVFLRFKYENSYLANKYGSVQKGIEGINKQLYEWAKNL